MTRDLTMIFAVLLSLVSVGFGVYKNMEASNAEGFANEQAFRILNLVTEANVSAGVKDDIISEALDSLSNPPAIIDLSRSSADAPIQLACSEKKKTSCSGLASELADANVACVKNKGTGSSCLMAAKLKVDILEQGCFVCYSQ